MFHLFFFYSRTELISNSLTFVLALVHWVLGFFRDVGPIQATLTRGIEQSEVSQQH
jgi:hypothetical protein